MQLFFCIFLCIRKESGAHIAYAPSPAQVTKNSAQLYIRICTAYSSTQGTALSMTIARTVVSSSDRQSIPYRHTSTIVSTIGTIETAL